MMMVCNSIYEQSIFFAINHNAITKKYQQYKDFSLDQKIKIGVTKGVEGIFAALIIQTGLKFVLRGMPAGKVAKCAIPSLFNGQLCAILEEIFFRGILQNCLVGSQKMVTNITPQCLQNNRIFRWLTSPSPRILIINSIFAYAHLSNAGGYASSKDSLIQCIRIMLKPSFGILHETTGDIIAPIACHMTNNFFGHFIDKWESSF